MHRCTHTRGDVSLTAVLTDQSVRKSLTLTPNEKMSAFADTIFRHKYSMDGKEEWEDTSLRVAREVVGPYFPSLVGDVARLIAQRKLMPGGRYLYATGRPFHQVNNCLLMTVDDSREGWASLMHRITSALMTGAGIGVVYSQLREEGALVRGMGGTSTGPLALAQMVNEAGRHIMQGGSRRAAIWGGLHWSHPDVLRWCDMKNWSDMVKIMKEQDFNHPAPLDGTNISVILDDAFFAAYSNSEHAGHAQAHEVYWTVVNSMLKTGEPGFSIDVGANAGEHLRNACTEVTSADDNDICNLGSVNLARIEDTQEMSYAVEMGTVLLLCGSLYSKVPFDEVAVVREKNRRLGLGLMGIADWLATRDKKYGPDWELESYLEIYSQSTDIAASYADRLSISRPVKTRAIAPTGTIGILAETTTGIEPMYCAAYKRRYLKARTWHYQYVIDATAQRLADAGVDPDGVEDAYDLAQDPGRRLGFQQWVQGYVDHGISSTLNLPAHEEQDFSPQEFGETLLTHLPGLRGVTAYPDGARGGQPLNRVTYKEAIGQVGVEYEEAGNSHACASGVCGT